MHTTFSDGSCDYDTLINAAENAGLDYICVTDHMNLGGKDKGREGKHNNLFVLIGYEHNDKDDRNHYLAFGVNEVAGSTDTQEYIDEIKKMGGIGFIAHPAEKRHYTPGPFPWTKWDVNGFDGIEIWNQVSDWLEQLRGWHSCAKFVFRTTGPAPKELLERWDGMNREKFVSAVGGVDGHSHTLFSFGPFKYVIFPVKKELRGVRTHLFVDGADWQDEKRAGEALIAAMRDGKGFISNFARGDARGSRIFLRDGQGNTEYPGRPSDNLSFPITVNAELSRKAKITLLRNGAAIQSTNGKNAVWTIREPGVYRVEAYRRGGAWIYSNPLPVGKYPL
jgi:hypothetical protein